jgi:GTPase SAR1 family protein
MLLFILLVVVRVVVVLIETIRTTVGPLSRPVQVELSEVAHESFIDHQFRFNDAFVVVFNICSSQSLDDAALILEAIRLSRGVNSLDIPWLLVGTQSDRRSERQVPWDRACEMAKRNRALYLEVSAKAGTAVTQVLTRIGDQYAALRSLGTFSHACYAGDLASATALVPTIDDEEYNRVCLSLSLSLSNCRCLYSILISCMWSRVYCWHWRNAILPLPNFSWVISSDSHWQLQWYAHTHTCCTCAT